MDNQTDTVTHSDRRKHPRVAAQGTGYVFRALGDEIVRVNILNICIAGFGCRSRGSFETGERINCVIAVGERANDRGNLYLLCRARVVRVEESEDAEQPFRLGCQIQEYHVIHAGGAAPGPKSGDAKF